MSKKVREATDKLFALYRLREQGADVSSAISHVLSELQEAVEEQVDKEAKSGREKAESRDQAA